MSEYYKRCFPRILCGIPGGNVHGCIACTTRGYYNTNSTKEEGMVFVPWHSSFVIVVLCPSFVFHLSFVILLSTSAYRLLSFLCLYPCVLSVLRSPSFVFRVAFFIPPIDFLCSSFVFRLLTFVFNFSSPSLTIHSSLVEFRVSMMVDGRSFVFRPCAYVLHILS